MRDRERETDRQTHRQRDTRERETDREQNPMQGQFMQIAAPPTITIPLLRESP